jgi:hypothetical protein
VHFTIPESLEHAASVQSVAISVLAMHRFGIVHESMEFGSQQPCTPSRVFVAQTKFVLEHVIDDSFKLLAYCNIKQERMTIRNEPDMYAHVLLPCWS